MAVDDYGSNMSLNRLRYDREQRDFFETISRGETMSKLEVFARLQYLDMLALDATTSDATGHGLSSEDRRRDQFNNLNDILAHDSRRGVEPPFSNNEITAFKATITALAWYLEGERFAKPLFSEDR